MYSTSEFLEKIRQLPERDENRLQGWPGDSDVFYTSRHYLCVNSKSGRTMDCDPGLVSLQGRYFGNHIQGGLYHKGGADEDLGCY